MVTPGSADLAFVDELISVTMIGTSIVLRPTRRPDGLGTRVFTDVVNAATAAGSTVVLRQPGAPVNSTDSTVANDMPTAGGLRHAAPVPADAGGIGLLIIRSESAVWTIDFTSDRFVQSDQPVDRLVLAGSDWTPFHELWIGPRHVRALTANGSYITGIRKLQERCEHEAHHDQPVALELSDIA